MAPKFYVTRRGREGSAIVQGWNEFNSQHLRGLSRVLRRGVDWEAFTSPEDAAVWLDDNRLPENEDEILKPATPDKISPYTRIMWSTVVLVVFALVHQLLKIAEHHFCGGTSAFSLITAPWYIMMPHCRQYMSWAIWAADYFYYSTLLLVGVIGTIIVPIASEWMGNNTFLNLRVGQNEF